MGTNVIIEHFIRIFRIRQKNFPRLEGFDNLRAQFGKKAIPGIQALANDNRIFFLHMGDNVLETVSQGCLVRQVKLIVQDDTADPRRKHARCRMPTHPAVDKNGEIAVFQIPLHQHKGCVRGYFTRGFIAL